MKTVFELIEANGLTLHGDIEHFAEVVVAENSAVLNKEIDRLKQQIRGWECRSDSRSDSRIGTHSPTCYAFGPHHYECALRKIEELESER